jgi:hypothetical protein
MLGMVEAAAAALHERPSRRRVPGHDQQHRAGLALPAQLQRGVQQRGADALAPRGGIDHAGQFDGGRAVRVETQEAEQPVAVPPQHVLDVLPGAVAQRVPLQLEPAAVGRYDPAFQVLDGAEC